MGTDNKLEREVSAIADLSREELTDRWLATYDCRPPKGVRRELLIRSAAWHLQAKRLGGFSIETKRRLKNASRHVEARLKVSTLAQVDGAAADSDGNPVPKQQHQPGASPDRAQPSPGTRLIRVWNDRTHVVDVTEGGYVFDGRSYRSLSAVAKRITGAHWSGPRFFGL